MEITETEDEATLISAYRYLARLHARRLYRSINAIPIDDLEAYGIVGLLKAARRFDESLGVKFNSFADQHVSGAIKDGIRAERKSHYRGFMQFVALPMNLDAPDTFEAMDARATADILIRSALSAIEARVVRMRLEGRTLQDIGTAEGLDKSKVCQICRRAMNVLTYQATKRNSPR